MNTVVCSTHWATHGYL